MTENEAICKAMDALREGAPWMVSGKAFAANAGLVRAIADAILDAWNQGCETGEAING